MSNIYSTTAVADSISLDDLAYNVELLRIVEDQIGRLTALKNTLRSTLKVRLGEHEIGTVNGVPVVSYTTELRVITVVKTLKERYPEQARECEDIIPVRKFRVLDAA
ncbi:hypothetical protein FKR81_32350 [Lentzea tibetensis]|uniref:Uncharacterized protein n=1 Tax=Lentzea tibetensis TaxID=2591470 RepID=A0A563EK66_9PSEU|nr:hypothetical protein [Lentzea tibetensis]TWP47407.1 hypothetical protein FKR81_32350 [Lentzea tibetensis]